MTSRRSHLQHIYPESYVRPSKAGGQEHAARFEVLGSAPVQEDEEAAEENQVAEAQKQESPASCSSFQPCLRLSEFFDSEGPESEGYTTDWMRAMIVNSIQSPVLVDGDGGVVAPAGLLLAFAWQSLY